jgi:hypothetical protein
MLRGTNINSEAWDSRDHSFSPHRIGTPARMHREPMRITHVTRQFTPAVGGLENVVHNLAKAPLKAGQRVRVITLNRDFAKPNIVLPEHEDIDGIEVVRACAGQSPRLHRSVDQILSRTSDLGAAVQSAGDRPAAAATCGASDRHGAPMRDVPQRVWSVGFLMCAARQAPRHNSSPPGRRINRVTTGPAWPPCLNSHTTLMDSP